MTENKQMPPAANQGHSENPLVSDPILSPAHDGLVAGIYVAVVQIRGDHTPKRFRKRVYFNLPSAQRAIDRATMAGLDASIILCQLTPVSGVLDD